MRLETARLFGTLERDLVCFDLETTGTNPETDRIVQLAGVRLCSTDNGWVCDVEELDMLVDPGIPIPATATDVHRISDADVTDAFTFTEVAQQVVEFVSGADLVGYNLLAFDIPLLVAELTRAGIEWSPDGVRIIDVFEVFRRMEPRTLARALSFYCGEKLSDGLHNALVDTEVTLSVLLAQIGRYQLGVDRLAALSMGDRVTLDGKVVWDGDGQACLSFGKFANVPLDEVVRQNRGYLTWMLNQDFPTAVKAIVRRVLSGEETRRAP